MLKTNAVSTNLDITGTITNHLNGDVHRRTALTTRFVDFWLLGGLSLVMFAVMFLISVPYPYFILAAPLLQLTIEFPHLMASYRLVWGRGWPFIRQHAFRLLVFPLAFIAAFAFISWSWAIGFIFFAAGWHRIRQVYGCMIIYSLFDGRPLRLLEKRVTSFMLYSVWLAGYANMLAYPHPMNFFGVDLPQIPISKTLLSLINAGLFLGLLSFIMIVLVFKSWRERRVPSANFLVPWIAIMVWFSSYLVSLNYFLYLTPTFHSLQYLGFVAGYGRERKSLLHYLRLASALMIAGYIVMRIVPEHLGNLIGSGILGMYILVSLHHYLVDSVIWKTSDKPVYDNLIRARGA
jgi:hypothetical protein